MTVLQKQLGGADQAALLASVNARHGTAPARATALTYFDKHQHRPILHDQVKLTRPVTDIASQQFQTMLQQVIEGALLGLGTAHLAFGLAAGLIRIRLS